MSTIVRPQPPAAGLRVNVAAYGAVADAKVLTDATMSSGSAVLTSAAAPFTAADVGKLIYVANAGGSGQPLKTTIASYQSSAQVTLTATASAASLVSGGPNINAVYGTPNAAAFNAALAAAASGVPAVSDVRSRYAPRKRVDVPAGGYLIEAALTPVTKPGLGVSGAGMQSTHLYFCESGALFSADTYTASPADAYVGTAPGFTVTDLTINGGVWYAGGYENSRVGTGVQDNGSGDLYLGNVTFIGLRYGFCGAYGSDFTRFGPNVYFRICDVGAYLGPGSQQIYIAGTDFYQCREGLVIEGAPHVHMTGGSFEDPLIAAVSIEAKATGTTRSGVSVSLSGATYLGTWSFTGTWFESNAGASGRLAPRMIWLNGDGPGSASPTGLAVRDCYLVSGGTQAGGGTASFAEITTAVSTATQALVIDKLVIRGNFINSIVYSSGASTTSSPVILNTVIPTGSNISTVTGPGGGGGAVIFGQDLYTGALNIAPRIAATTVFTIRQFTSGGGTSPLVKVRSDASSTFISGIAQGGALVGARIDAALAANGAVTIDASRANVHSVLLQANATSSSITNPTNGQQLTIEWRQDGTGSRTYAWPTTCKFAGGAAPTASTTAAYVDSVTFVYDSTNTVWRETGRAVAIR